MVCAMSKKESINFMGDLVLGDQPIVYGFGFDSKWGSKKYSGIFDGVYEYTVSTKYNVDIWGDDCWGCPRYDVFVGLRNVKCDISIVKAFVDIYSNFGAFNGCREFADIRKRRLEDLLSQCWEYSHLNIREREDIDYAPLEDKSVVSYSGKEYVLLKTKLENAAIKKSHYELFLKILEETCT